MWAVLAVTAGLLGCFTGDDLAGQPCREDDDCNAVVHLLGGHLSCQDGVCGALCGDSAIQSPSEACDDGNADNTDDCVHCQDAFCGDDATWDGVEECDDGNDLDTDACARCNTAFCGDGFVWAGREQCDDGNSFNSDSCVDCKHVACGDGAVNPGSEACDDGDADANDGCNTACEMGAERLSRGRGFHTCAIRAGALRCWGSNFSGQLGYGTTAPVGDDERDMPPIDVPVGAAVLDVVIGSYQTCVLLDETTENVRCWGAPIIVEQNPFDPINLGDEEGELPTPPLPIGGKVIDLALSDSQQCALLEDGTIRCWSNNLLAQLGEPPLDLGVAVVQIAVGDFHTCALLQDGSLRCWGSNDSGQLGYGHVMPNFDPQSVGPVELDAPVVQIVTGAYHTCAVLMTGDVRCWGDNGTGQAGASAVSYVLAPLDVDPVDLGGRAAIQVSAGAMHTCALLDDASVRCWGDNQQGALGVGNLEPVILPKNGAVDLGAPVRQLSAGYNFTCALHDGGGVRCWGLNEGRLGLGHTDPVGGDPDDMPPPLLRLYSQPGQ